MSPSTSTNDPAMGPGKRSSIRERVRAGAFWAAVLMPFCTLALLGSGLDTTVDYLTLVALLAGNVLALFVGHGYRA